MIPLLLLALVGCPGTTEKPETDTWADTGWWSADPCGKLSVDCDGDGYALSAGDRDDDDPETSPDADEICNEHDDDCDGLTDERGGAPSYADDDGDGYGDPADDEACTPRDGYVTNALDCDDDDPLVSPDAAEVCDGVDNDCDDVIEDVESLRRVSPPEGPSSVATGGPPPTASRLAVASTFHREGRPPVRNVANRDTDRLADRRL